MTKIFRVENISRKEVNDLKKIFRHALTAIFVVAFMISASVANAEVKTYEGTDEYIMNEAENLAVAKERAKEKALRNAREKAGVYIHSFSKTIDFELVEDEIISIVSGILRVIEVHFDTTPLPEANGFTIRATVKANIDTNDLEKWLQKDSEEISKIVEQDKEIQRQEEEQAQKIEELKVKYEQATTPEQKEVIVQQIAEEDNAFLSGLKLREGNKFRDNGDHKKSAELFTEAIELNPNRGFAYLEGFKNYTKAIEDFKKATQIAPDYKYSYANLGRALTALKNYNQALENFNQAINLDSNYGYAYWHRGKCYEAMGETSKAQADFAKAKELGYNG